ncbi:glycosyltransferase family 1 protein [Lysobacter sp. N42]|uniref:glycosyltransferase family 1 protein n=1 Tax=Lysobacter sp. N42 TaxID=2545719 RepID=UPI001050DB3F|nr:glycosyltransferase family 1 protein [Lysobacter sp. N42]TCZ86194.1 glycosyltransferase family 1 protein [Lysobacter sp. N42]
MRDLLFHRDFRGYSGGHGKVFDYFMHARAHPGFQPRIWFTPESIDVDNPWRHAGVPAETAWRPSGAAALFIGGMDWLALHGDAATPPVINLVQHVRHADPTQPLRRFLRRRAIRICVSSPVAEAIASTGEVNGPVLVIDAGLRLPDRMPRGDRQPRHVFIAAAKQPAIGRDLADALRAEGRSVDLCVDWVEHAAFLERMARAEIAVALPFPTEGFFLPALEAMTLGCATVVPDCVGNRAYLRPGVNALAPRLELDALRQAVARLDDAALRGRLISAATATAARFDLERERAAFHRVLDDLDALWRS